MRDRLSLPATHDDFASRRRWPRQRWLVCAIAAAATTPLYAQSTGGRTFALQPRLSIKETLTSNALLTTDARSDAITEFTAGVSVASNGGRLRGYLDYGLTGYYYANRTDTNTYQNSLNARLGADLIEGRARLDMAAGISQSAISAFGVQPGTSGLPSSNVTEYRTFTVTPSFRGPLGPSIQYDAGLTYSVSDARGTSVGSSSNDTAYLRLRPWSPGVIGWSVDGSILHSKYGDGGYTVDNRLYGTMTRKIDTLDLLVDVSAGAEESDMASLQRQRYQTWGVGGTWEPSPRTRLAAHYEERFFGSGHNITFEHRTALTTWTFSDHRDLSTSGNGTTLAGRGGNFDLYYAQFAAIEPDPAKRTELVNAFLKANGIPTDAGTTLGYLRSGVTVQRGQTLAMAVRGVRTTGVISISRSVDMPPDSAVPPSQDFAGTSSIVTEAASFTLGHSLTPLSSASLGIIWHRNRGDRTEQYTAQREVNLQYTLRVNDRAGLIAGTRRVLFEGHQAPYNETAAFATLGITF